MCSLYEQQIAWDQYCQMMQELEWRIPNQQSEIDLPQAAEIGIAKVGPVMRAELTDPAQVELALMTFGFPPASPKGGPVFNFRSEGRDFGKSMRCLIPASAFFEFTGTKYPKAKHRFSLNGAPFMAIAAVWRAGHGNVAPSFSMLTTEPGPDVAPYHNRQIVVLRPEDWKSWIYLTRPQGELLRPLPAGSFTVENVRAGSDQPKEKRKKMPEPAKKPTTGLLDL